MLVLLLIQVNVIANAHYTVNAGLYVGNVLSE